MATKEGSSDSNKRNQHEYDDDISTITATDKQICSICKCFFFI